MSPRIGIRPPTAHTPVDPSDAESMCKPDCPACAELVAATEAEFDASPLAMAFGSLGPDKVGAAEFDMRRVEAIEKFLDEKFPGWRPR